MKRRSFLGGLVAAVGGLVVPYEPKVVYSFPSRLFEANLRRTALLEAMGNSVGFLRFYSGSGVLLAESVISADGWQRSVDGAMSLKQPINTEVDRSGTYQRLELADAHENRVSFQAEAIRMNTNSFVVGDKLRISSFTVTQE